MKRSILAVAAAVPLLAAVAPVEAAPKKPAPRKPVCFQIKDASNDATGNGTGAVATPNDPSSDIVSGDIATNGQWVTAVLRLSSVAENATNSPFGRAYSVSFLGGGRVVTLRGLVSPAGNSWFGGKGQGKVDAATNTVWIHAKLSDLGVTLKPNDKLTELKASTARWVGTTTASLGIVDTAVAAAPYVVGWPTCLAKVGP